MKITKEVLTKIIKEEIQALIEQQDPLDFEKTAAGASKPSDPLAGSTAAGASKPSDPLAGDTAAQNKPAQDTVKLEKVKKILAKLVSRL